MEHHYKKAKDKNLYKISKKGEMKWRKWVLKWMRSDNGLVMVAEDDGRIVGYSLNHIKDNAPVYELGKLGHCDDLFVKATYRNKGIGRTFIKKAFGWFRKKRIGYASIAVHEINPRARKLYREIGFCEFHHELRIRL